MGLSALASIEPDCREQFRAMMHEELDQWVDELLPVFDEDRQPTLMEMSDLFSQTRQKLLGACLQRLIEQKYAELFKREYSPCPRCGKVNKRRRDQSKEFVTMHGSCTINRPWFYCVPCSMGYSPVDEVLELSSKKHQLDIQKKSVKLSAEVPFEGGSEIFSDLTGLDISNHFIHATFEEVGSHAYLEDVIPEREEMASRITESTSRRWRPILVVASDGAHLPTRRKAKRHEKRGKGSWQEAKGFRVYLLSEGRIIHLASWHQIQDEQQFGKDLELVSSRIPQDAVRIALLGDGADWLWKHMIHYFPKGREILDYYHCVEHIQSLKGLEWIESTISRLFYGEISNVIGGLCRMDPKSSEAKEEIRKLMGYLKNNHERIHYRSDRAGGYPIGSGGIESANKYICHTRMKRTGAWWVKENGNEMLRIRCAIYNGTYDKVFERYKTEHLFNRLSLTFR
jgi:uncharacterized C2H2 Zn-finger protein